MTFIYRIERSFDLGHYLSFWRGVGEEWSAIAHVFQLGLDQRFQARLIASLLKSDVAVADDAMGAMNLANPYLGEAESRELWQKMIKLPGLMQRVHDDPYIFCTPDHMDLMLPIDRIHHYVRSRRVRTKGADYLAEMAIPVGLSDIEYEDLEFLFNRLKSDEIMFAFFNNSERLIRTRDALLAKRGTLATFLRTFLMIDADWPEGAMLAAND